MGTFDDQAWQDVWLQGIAMQIRLLEGTIIPYYGSIDGAGEVAQTFALGRAVGRCAS
jgi:hypothetical protein